MIFCKLVSDIQRLRNEEKGQRKKIIVPLAGGEPQDPTTKECITLKSASYAQCVGVSTLTVILQLQKRQNPNEKFVKSQNLKP